jgi:hypothetical protein
MSKLFVDNGLLSDQGKQLLKPVSESINKLFQSHEVKNLSVTQFRTLGANLAKIVGDAVSDYLINKNT